jgi:uncharacterized SAM-dependent methyltransferase
MFKVQGKQMYRINIITPAQYLGQIMLLHVRVQTICADYLLRYTLRSIQQFTRKFICFQSNSFGNAQRMPNDGMFRFRRNTFIY